MFGFGGKGLQSHNSLARIFVGSLTLKRQQQKDNEESRKPSPGKQRFCTLFEGFKVSRFKAWDFG